MEQFAKAEELLRQQDYKVVNPTRLLPCRWRWVYRALGYRVTLLYDLWKLSHCDLIYKMPGWKESHGANIESCWAYHTGIYTVPPKIREAVDKKLAKHMEKWSKRNLTVVSPLPPPPRPPKRAGSEAPATPAKIGGGLNYTGSWGNDTRSR